MSSCLGSTSTSTPPWSNLFCQRTGERNHHKFFMCMSFDALCNLLRQIKFETALKHSFQSPLLCGGISGDSKQDMLLLKALDGVNKTHQSLTIFQLLLVCTNPTTPPKDFEIQLKPQDGPKGSNLCKSWACQWLYLLKPSMASSLPSSTATWRDLLHFCWS